MLKNLNSFKGQAGFTMLEMMMVVAILALGAAVATFSIGAMMPDIRYKGAIRDIKSDMTLAKLNAIRTGSFVTIQFNPATDQYTMFNDDGGGNDDNEGNLAIDAGETVIKTVQLPNGVDLTSDTGFGLNDHARFNQLGQSWGAGSAVITNGANFLRVRTTLIGNLSIQTSPDGNEPWTDLNQPKVEAPAGP
jgi:prepilin-type N-terminal cleavage/methylation domain-containing protein